LEC
jgi:hypothetical protein